ncbi:DUF1566 domain-containing protein [Agitococcus lubricus]|uniref:Uncharacterized protein DUF1566 n=1 Tax=Agitococcus lubricus TaxID=1077255 RepID=A0A2T5J0Z3_9GAMM|nr:DUF1566 domain-containing protein [Agitococcus lubricus]PTQ90004.1 uncharacterized protein DUF1566 [Agitococcus lubricus]
MTRITLLVGLSALLLVACNENNTTAATPSTIPSVSAIQVPTKVFIGQPVTVSIIGSKLSPNSVNIETVACTDVAITQQSATVLRLTCTPQAQQVPSIQVKNTQGKLLLKQTFIADSLATNALNDTGVIDCQTETDIISLCAGSGLGEWSAWQQDANVGRDYQAQQGQLAKLGAGAAGFDFTKIDISGKPLAANATVWHCVRDNHTGLLWEAKTNDGGLEDYDNTYTWYNPDTAQNGGNFGLENGNKNTLTYIQAINQQGLCGYKDWRLPTAEQLQGLVHYGQSSPTIDTHYFPNTQSANYWTAETTGSSGQFAVVVMFEFGLVRSIAKNQRFSTNENYIRLVRAGHE